MIVEDGLTPKRGPNLLRIGIPIVPDVMTAGFFGECILGRESGLDKPILGVHLLE